jgi:indole-3-glycerol phosphate synthase
MQVARAWNPPVGPLGRLSSASVARAAIAREAEPFEQQLAAALAHPAAPDLLAALRAATGVAVIAEIKRQSPSKGSINKQIDANAQIRAYAAGGAAACSILTEPSEFGGALDDLRVGTAARALPCIRKDFITDSVQLVEARNAGAAAALLIARALPTDALMELVSFARMVGVEPLVEVRDEYELDDALMSGALLIGVNNRNLETLQIDATLSARLLPLVPRTHVAVFESGVSERSDVEFAAGCGADAVLVGSVLSASDRPEGAVRALVGVARVTGLRD